MLLLVATTTLLAQAVLPDDYLIYSALIKLKDGSSGSGFFYGSESNLFLVTARHVLFNPDSGKLNAESATITYYFKHETNATSRGGYDVVTLKNKVEALKRLEEIKPDLVTTDLASPQLGGLDFIREVKEFDPSSPCLEAKANIAANVGEEVVPESNS